MLIYIIQTLEKDSVFLYSIFGLSFWWQAGRIIGRPGEMLSSPGAHLCLSSF